MLGKFATKIQGLFNFGLRNERKRTSDIDIQISVESKRLRLFESDSRIGDSLGLGCSDFDIPKLEFHESMESHKPSKVGHCTKNQNHVDLTEESRHQDLFSSPSNKHKEQRGARESTNGYNFTEAEMKLYSRYNFYSHATDDGERKTHETPNFIGRPSIHAYKGDSQSANHNQACILKAPPTDRHQLLYEKVHERVRPGTAAETAKSNKYYSKYLTAKQCIKMDEKRKYRSLIEKYISAGTTRSNNNYNYNGDDDSGDGGGGGGGGYVGISNDNVKSHNHSYNGSRLAQFCKDSNSTSSSTTTTLDHRKHVLDDSNNKQSHRSHISSNNNNNNSRGSNGNINNSLDKSYDSWLNSSMNSSINLFSAQQKRRNFHPNDSSCHKNINRHTSSSSPISISSSSSMSIQPITDWDSKKGTKLDQLECRLQKTTDLLNEVTDLTKSDSSSGSSNNYSDNNSIRCRNKNKPFSSLSSSPVALVESMLRDDDNANDVIVIEDDGDTIKCQSKPHLSREQFQDLYHERFGALAAETTSSSPLSPYFQASPSDTICINDDSQVAEDKEKFGNYNNGNNYAPGQSDCLPEPSSYVPGSSYRTPLGSSHHHAVSESPLCASSETLARPSIRRDFELKMTTLPILNKDFVKEVWTKTEMDEKSREVIVTQIQLDEYKKCRMDDEELVSRRMKRLLNITRRLPVPNEEHYLHISDQEEEEDDDDVKIIDGVFEEAVDEFPELSAEQESEVNRALKCTSASKVLVEGFRLQITSKDISTLAGLNWLNDEVINFYMSLIVERSQLDTSLPPVYAFNTFFYPKVAADGHKSVRRWTKNVDLFGHGLILVPVHLGVHWCLAVIDFYKKELQYYDSMGGDNRRCLDVLLTYLVDEMNDKKQEKFDTSGWVKILLKDIPQQMNGSDCGMFACKFAEYVTRRAKFTFNQSHMPYFRRRMIYEILTKKLM